MIRELQLFYYFHKHVLSGKRIYLELKKKYGDHCKIYINHHPGTGDVFICASLINAWNKKQGVNEFVFTVIGKNAYNMAKLFNIKNVEMLTEKQTEDILCYLQTMGEANHNIEVLHFVPFAFKQRIMDPLLGINKTSFMDMFLNVTFPGLTIQDMKLPEDNTSNQEMLDLFKKNGLVPGKTVILIPYTNTIDPLDEQFWNYLANGFLQKGYAVCTNCNYPQEPTIQGTVPIFLPYSKMKKLAEMAGIVVQMRSGLTDLLYDINCKNYILYPIENSFRFGRTSLYEYFSLTKMGLQNHATEIEFSRDHAHKVVRKILSEN